MCLFLGEIRPHYVLFPVLFNFYFLFSVYPGATPAPQQFSATIRWDVPSPLPSDLVSYLLEYRQDLGGGRFGEWTTGGSNIDRTASSYVLTLPVGNYEFRVQGALSGGGQRPIAVGTLRPGEGRVIGT